MNTSEREQMVEQGSVDVVEAQRLTGLGRTFLYTAMDRGEIKYIKAGKRRLIPRSEITRYLAERLVGG